MADSTTKAADPRESARRGVTGERGDYPKPLVRLKQGANGWEAEVREVADQDAEAVATDSGFQAIDLIEKHPDFVEFPKWKYHADGRSQVVYTKEEEDALDGYEDMPPEPEEAEGALPKGTVPPPSAAVVGGASKNRPPVPADRG